MARAVRNAKIDTRSARAKVPMRREPYWTVISQGCAIGYRRGSKGGTWIARYRDDDGKQKYHSIGPADDARDPDGISVLDYAQAQKAAHKWFAEAVMRNDPDMQSGPYTVKDAINDYKTDYERRSGKDTDRMQTVIDAHILPALGNIEIKKLTRSKVRNWHQSIAEAPARLRTRQGKTQNVKEAPTAPDEKRKRRNTANRIFTILKAALNHAYHDGKVSTNAAWMSVKPFQNVDFPKVRYLTDEEATRLVNACSDDLKAIVIAALLTGSRYGEIAALKANDFDPNAGTLHIAESKSGKSRNIALTDEGGRFFEQVVAGKSGGVLVFRRLSGGAWGRSHQSRLIHKACEIAKIDPVIGFHILRHTYGSRLAMRGVPMAVIAEQLGHADTRMTERHYAHLGPSYVSETVRAAFSDMGLVPELNVKPMRKKKKSR